MNSAPTSLRSSLTRSVSDFSAELDMIVVCALRFFFWNADVVRYCYPSRLSATPHLCYTNAICAQESK
jgi:hypothetical protein